MFVQFKRLLKRLKKLEIKDWRILCLLMGGAFILGQFMVYLNVGTMDLYLKKDGIFDVGFDFLWVGILISFVGRITVKLDRRRGYGGAPLTLILFGLLSGLLWWIQEVSNSQLIPHLFFLYAYTVPVLLQVAFWMIAHRFISLRMDSYKFLGVFGGTLLGMIYGGSKIAQGHFDNLSVLMMALTCLGVLFALMKLLVWLLPVPSETFVKKSGGVQDAVESKLVACILCMSLVFTSAQGLMDYLLYQTLLERNILTSLANLWFAKAALGILILASCYRVSYIYQAVGATLLMCFTFSLAGFFFAVDKVFCGWVAAVSTGSLIYLYWGTLLQILPRVLILGQGLRIRFVRDVLCVPLGWVLAGSLILTFSNTFVAQILILLSCVLLVCILMALYFYNRFFIQMCRTRRWCSGPMILLSKKAKDFLMKGVRFDNLNEALYFYRLMSQAGYSGYKHQLVKGLKHSIAEVRLFCVDKLDKMGLEPLVYRQLTQLFHTEKNEAVKARILAALIHREGEENTSKVFHKFGEYLDDKKLKSGAILGFLQTGGECALLAMDGLQHLAQSKKKEDIFQALDIIEHVPQTGLIRLVLPLLKHENKEVVKHAIETAGHIGHTQSLSFILSSLDNPELQEVSLRSLKMYDKLALPPIEKMIANVHVPMARRKKLISFLACLPSGEGKQILLRSLDLPDQKLRKDVLKALLDSKIVWAARPRKRFLFPALMQDVAHWNWLKENIQKCSQAPDTSLADSFGFLERSFLETQKDLRTIILYQLLLLYPNVLVEKAIQMIGRPQITQQLNGIDILQDLISPTLYRVLRPILLDPIEPDKTIVDPLNKTQAHDFLKHLILNPEFELDRWASACALYGLKSEGNKEDLAVLKCAFSMPWEIVWEAALEDLEAWLDKKEAHQFLKNLLSDSPNQGFVHYLKTRRANDYL